MAQCARCGRKLKDPVSIQRKYGNTCWEKINEQPDLIFLLTHGVEEETEYERYQKLLKKQVEKELKKVVV